MTKEQAKELLPIIQAFAEGKTIQFNYNDRGWENTYPTASVSFDYSLYKFRIKPEPREFWIVKRGEHSIVEYEALDAKPLYAESIHVKEIID